MLSNDTEKPNSRKRNSQIIPTKHSTTSHSRQRMPVNGKIDLELASAWQKGRIGVLVSSGSDDNMLWDITHLKEFRQIPQGFPNTILNDNRKFCFRTTIKLLSDEFTSEFEDILSNELKPEPIKGDPVRISLKPNDVPKKVMGARHVPLRYEEGADSVAQDLINKKVIVPVNKTTNRCSPAFFVPKADMIHVRLVQIIHTSTNM